MGSSSSSGGFKILLPIGFPTTLTPNYIEEARKQLRDEIVDLAA
jgi:hypothetical protein